jgi:hypothetical protein
LLRSQTDGNHDTFQILHYIVIGEPEHAVSAGRKPFIAPTVVAKTEFEIVTFTVNLNDKLA